MSFRNMWRASFPDFFFWIYPSGIKLAHYGLLGRSSSATFTSWFKYKFSLFLKILFNLGIAVAKSKKTNEEGLLKSKQESQVTTGVTGKGDSDEEAVPSKRRKMTANETVECVMPSLDEER